MGCVFYALHHSGVFGAFGCRDLFRGAGLCVCPARYFVGHRSAGDLPVRVVFAAPLRFAWKNALSFAVNGESVEADSF